MAPRRRARLVAAAAAAIALGAAIQPVATGTAAGVTQAPPGSVSFTVYTPPVGTAGRETADEPSIGANWTTGAIMYQSDLVTLKVGFNDATIPATPTWTNVSGALTSATSLDPILFTDHITGRTIVSQLIVACSLSEYTDTDGTPPATAWTPNQGCPPNGAEDHQTVGGGPFHAPIPGPPAPVYPDAVYYCSQDFANSTAAFCSPSFDGGLTYTAGIPVYNFTQCGGLHGHIRVAPDGTAILPNQTCAPTDNPLATGPFPNQAAVVSTTNGAPGGWSVNVIPDSTYTLRSDPSTAADAANKWYFGYESGVFGTGGTQVAGRAKIATSSTGGTTWTPSVDVGAPFGIQNVTFPEVITGDSGRAAYAFLGSTTAGNPEDTAFQGTWELYVAMTYDGGTTWTISDLTPGDPVQRDCIFLAGTVGPGNNCPSSKRNLLDFMDITVDNHGRVLVGYADGCTDGCDQGLTCNSFCSTGPGASIGHRVQIARMTCGKGLLAQYDGTFACASQAVVPEVLWVPATLLIGGGVTAIAWRRRRRFLTS